MINRLLRRVFTLLSLFSLTACSPEPPLYLYDSANADIELPYPEVDLKLYWDYTISIGYGYDIKYDWTAYWYYGWDDHDRYDVFKSEIDYTGTEPTVFNLRRYHTGDVPYGPHLSTVKPPRPIEGNHYEDEFEWGFWDILVWNELQVDVLSLHFDETDERIIAYTNPSMFSSRYQAPRYTRSFYAPEPLFAAYQQAIEINRDLRDFDYDAEHNVYIRRLDMKLKPVTYIYLMEVILHHNNGRITSVDGNANLSGMARSTTLNTGITGEDAVTVYFNTNMKKNMPLIPYDPETASDPRIGADPSVERVDVIGGRLLSFGICGIAPNSISRAEEVVDPHRHYFDVTMQFNNGMDSTFVFDVTEQVRQRYKGGVIKVELDVDTVPIPTRSGGSGFNAVVKETEDGGTYEFDM